MEIAELSEFRVFHSHCLVNLGRWWILDLVASLSLSLSLSFFVIYHQGDGALGTGSELVMRISAP